jgi:hypothetical protein
MLPHLDLELSMTVKYDLAGTEKAGMFFMVFMNSCRPGG